MTKRRPSNKKPVGLNHSLGSCLTNARERTRKLHQRSKFDGDIENPAFLETEEKKVVDSITEESGLDEFLAKAELAGTEFTADRDNMRIIEKEAAVIIPSRKDYINNIELQAEYEHRLKIPRRPSRDLWETVEELNRLENDVFLKWRADLAGLQEVNGLSLTPFERNPEMWKELWRVVEKSDIIVQIVDARNPMLFRSKDLDRYVREIDPAKQTLLLVNKADLLLPEQITAWTNYFTSHNIPAVFWSAVEELATVEEELEIEEDLPAHEQPSCSAGRSEVLFLRRKEDLLEYFKELGHVRGDPGERQLIVGMVGYPNVGKSSTINKLVGGKKVSVSSTPGKTRHFQTIHIDKQLCLCDCPGLVMPSFSFGRNEMFLNGIMSVDQMREHFGPCALLLSRIPVSYLESLYSVMLPDKEQPSAVDLLTAIAFMRGFMSSSGIPDCSRAARLLVKDVVCGKLLWVASPPDVNQEEFDKLLFPEIDSSKKKMGMVQLQQLEKRGLLVGEATENNRIDSGFFTSNTSNAHIRTANSMADARSGVASDLPSNTAIPAVPSALGSKKHFNGKKKQKLRNIYCGMYA